MATTEPRKLEGKVIGLSISASPDLAALGLSDLHVREALVRVSELLLSQGAALVYGGHLKAEGYTRVLFNAARTYNGKEADGRPKIHNLLAWPLHREWSDGDVEARKEEFAGLARLDLLPPPDGVDEAWPDDPAIQRGAWQVSLTAMRQKLVQYCDAFVLMGGKVEGFSGHMPGVAEEALLALKAEKPLFLCGGFGGCVADIVSTMRPDEFPQRFNRNSAASHPETGQGYTECLSNIAEYRELQPANGLDPADNALLANAVNSDHLAMLILHGLQNYNK